jgi:AcrR family transcriptional regulator
MKQAYHHKDLRNALITEATRMLSESGIAALTLRELARRLGVTHSAPYAHFADKTALLDGIANAGFTQLAGVLEAEKAAAPNPRQAISAMSLAYVRFAREQPNLYRLMFAAEELQEDPEGEMSPEGARAFAAVAGAIAELSPDRASNARVLAVAAWALVHGVAMLEIDHRMHGETKSGGDDIVEVAVETFVRGLAT